MLLNWVENFDCPIEGGIGSYFVTAVMYPLEGVGFLLLFSWVSSWWYFGVLQRLRIPVFTEKNLYKYCHNICIKITFVNFQNFTFQDCVLCPVSLPHDENDRRWPQKITDDHPTAPHGALADPPLPNEIWRCFCTSLLHVQCHTWVIDAYQMPLPAWLSPLLCWSACFSWMTWT